MGNLRFSPVFLRVSIHVPTDINYELVITRREKNTPYNPLFASPPSPLSYDFIVMPIKMKDDPALFSDWSRVLVS